MVEMEYDIHTYVFIGQGEGEARGIPLLATLWQDATENYTLNL